jgi:hypothetical protein
MQKDVITDLRMRVGRELGDWMRVEGLTSLRAAQQLGLSERTLGQLLNEQYCDLTVGELLKIWRSTGGDVEIVLRRPASG